MITRNAGDNVLLDKLKAKQQTNLQYIQIYDFILKCGFFSHTAVKNTNKYSSTELLRKKLPPFIDVFTLLSSKSIPIQKEIKQLFLENAHKFELKG